MWGPYANRGGVEIPTNMAVLARSMGRSPATRPPFVSLVPCAVPLTYDICDLAARTRAPGAREPVGVVGRARSVS